MLKNKFNLIIISALFLVLSVILYKQSGNILIDFSRESYIPYQISKGAKLGSDIFLIYGFFGYFINSLLYKISVNINLILIEASLAAYIISILFYFILKRVTTRTLALLFSLFFIILSVFSNSNFSFVIPYSYSTLWAVFALYLILFCEIYKKDKLKYFTIGFLGITKIEFFIITLIFFIIYDIYYKKFSIKNYLLILICPVLGGLYFIGNNLGDNFYYLTKMLKTNALKTLYQGMGSYFEINYFISNLKYLLIYLAAGALSYFIYKYNKIISLFILFVLFYCIYPNVLFHLGVFIAAALSIINRKKLKKYDYLILFTGIILSSKSMFALNSLLYSNFGWGIMIFYIFRQMYLRLNKNWVISHFIILFIILSIGQFLSYFNSPLYPIKTKIGTLKFHTTDYKLISKITKYLDNNLSENEDFIVIPEGQIFNLMYQKSYKFYNSTFTPLDFETFGDKYFIDELKKYKPTYVIFYPRNTIEYGAQTICYDYGVDFCTYIMDNYKREAIIDEEYRALIFKINEK